MDDSQPWNSHLGFCFFCLGPWWLWCDAQQAGGPRAMRKMSPIPQHYSLSLTKRGPTSRARTLMTFSGSPQTLCEGRQGGLLIPVWHMSNGGRERRGAGSGCPRHAVNRELVPEWEIRSALPDCLDSHLWFQICGLGSRVSLKLIFPHLECLHSTNFCWAYIMCRLLVRVRRML